MTEEEISRVRETWAIAVSAPDIFGRLFYDRLFEIAPETKALFSNDIHKQNRKLVDTLDFIVDELDEPDSLLPAARDLASRHVAYGVAPEHYELVGKALLSALERALGGEFSAQDSQAWSTAYTSLSSFMIESAYPKAKAE